jgi:hypothetical protein
MPARTFSDFLADVDPLLKRATAVQVSAFVMKSGDDWVVLTGRVITVEGDIAESRTRVEAGKTIGLRLVLGGEQVPKVVEALTRGCLLLPGEQPGEAVLPMERAADAPSWQDLHRVDRPTASRHYHVDWTTWRALLVGKGVSQVADYEARRDATERLPAHRPPFRDLRHLAQELQILDPPTGEVSAYIEFLVPIWARLHQVVDDPNDGGIKISVDVSTSLAARAELSVIPQDGRACEPVLLPVTQFQAADGEAEQRRGVVSLPSGAGAVEVVLSVDRQSVDRATAVVGLPSLRATTHRALLGDLGHLRKLLLGKGPDERLKDDAFERGVVWLLTLAGASSIHYGFRDLERAPDLVAYVDDQPGAEIIIVGECSVERLDSEKLGKLLARAATVAVAARSGGWSSVSVVPVMFTCQPRAVVEPLIAEQADAKRVLIVDRKALEHAVFEMEHGRERFWLRDLLANAPNVP